MDTWTTTALVSVKKATMQSALIASRNHLSTNRAAKKHNETANSGDGTETKMVSGLSGIVTKLGQLRH